MRIYLKLGRWLTFTINVPIVLQSMSSGIYWIGKFCWMELIHRAEVRVAAERAEVERAAEVECKSSG